MSLFTTHQSHKNDAHLSEIYSSTFDGKWPRNCLFSEPYWCNWIMELFSRTISRHHGYLI